MLVTGKFDIKLEPLEGYSTGIENIKLDRMSIDKVFYGVLSGSSKGEMLSALSPVKDSAGYVALEQISGELIGKKGTFVLQHSGIMQSSGKNLKIEVVPDSGTGELIGLKGEMEIKIEDGNHYYEFNFELKEE